MTSRDFCYWLQGFFEINAADEADPTPALTKEQVGVIQQHLSMVFVHEIDPSFPKAQQKKLDELHAPQQPGPSEAPSKFNRPPGMRC